MNRDEIIEWIEQHIQNIKKTKDADRTHDEAIEIFLKLRAHKLDALQRLAHEGESQDIEDYIVKELKNPGLDDEIRNEIRKIIATEYINRKFLSQMQKEKAIDSKLASMLKRIDFEKPKSIPHFVENELKRERYYDELKKIRNDLWELNLDSQEEVVSLHTKFETIRKNFQVDCPKEFERPNLFVNDIETDFAAFLTKGQIGSLDAVQRVQYKLITKAINTLSEKLALAALDQYCGVLGKLNIDTKGAVLRLLGWAVGMNEKNGVSPSIDSDLKIVHQAATHAIEKTGDENEKKMLKKALETLDMVLRRSMPQ